LPVKKGSDTPKGLFTQIKYTRSEVPGFSHGVTISYNGFFNGHPRTDPDTPKKLAETALPVYSAGFIKTRRRLP
jgi:hypothetical protein